MTTPLPPGSGGRRRPRGAGGHSDVRKVLERLYGPDPMKAIAAKTPVSAQVLVDPRTWWCGTVKRTSEAAADVFLDLGGTDAGIPAAMAHMVYHIGKTKNLRRSFDTVVGDGSVGGMCLKRYNDPQLGSLTLRIRLSDVILAAECHWARRGYLLRFYRNGLPHSDDGPAEVCTCPPDPWQAYSYNGESLGRGEEGKEALWRKLGKGRLTKRAVA